MTYRGMTEDITIVDGVEVDITVRGDEDRAEKVLMDLKERLGVIGAAYDQETPPDELEAIPSKFQPPMRVAWEHVLGDGTEGDDE